MRDDSFYIVDVFAQKRYEGNQLAVVKAWPNTSTNPMQKIAQEMNYAETTFIMAFGRDTRSS